MNFVTRQELEEIKKFTQKDIEMAKQAIEEMDMEILAAFGTNKGLANAYIEGTDIMVDRVTFELCYRVRLENYFKNNK